MRCHFTFSLPGVFLLFPILLSASSIIPFSNLGEATLYSESVVLAQANDTYSTQEKGIGYEETRFTVLENVKGNLPVDAEFVIRPWSHQVKDYQVNISGDFHPETGKTYLLFLQSRGQYWRPLLLSYYVFEQFGHGEDAYLMPSSGAGIEQEARPDGRPVEPLYAAKCSELLPFLRDFAQKRTPWKPEAGKIESTSSVPMAEERAVPTGCDFTLGGANNCRWQDPVIPVYYDDTSIPSGWSGTFSNVLSALNDNYDGIDPSNAGSTSFSPDCSGEGTAIGNSLLNYCDQHLNGSQTILIIFDDPCSEMGDLSNCSGILAFGGSYSTGTFHTFDGSNWENAIYGFLVINNGAPSCLSATQFEQVVEHELTHAYRMGHLNASSYPNQNMNPICCHAISTKDRECMNYAYPGFNPVELIAFSARLIEKKKVELHWTTAIEKDNDYFTLERSADGSRFELLAGIPGQNSAGIKEYTFIDAGPAAGVNYYRLSQTDFDGSMELLGTRAVVAPGNSDLVLFSNQTLRNSLQFQLDAPNTMNAFIEILTQNGQVLQRRTLEVEKGVQRFEQDIPDLPAGVYVLHIGGGNRHWMARFVR